jgi:signal transduction histidine kinase
LARKVNAKIPFIIVSGGVSETMAINCIQQGASDYVLKSDLYRLPLAIQKALHAADITSATREELLLKVEELSQANDQLENMLYGVAHNLRSPLNSVLGLLNLARHEGESLSKNMSHYFQMMEDSIRKLDTSVNDLLKYAKNTKKEVSIEKIDFKKIIQDGLEQMRFMKGFDRIQPKVEVNQSSLFYSDTYRVSSILHNLISNAIKYMDYSKADSFIKVAIEVTKQKVDIEFTDNGIGINKTYLAKVFTMFYRATSQNDGTGLGLYLVNDTVQKMGGTISIESQEGEGTSFHITLPNHYSTALS